MENTTEKKEMSLEERMLMYRSQTDYRIEKNSYVLVMLDGKNFSQKVKKKFKRPFDEFFINLMNETAAYVCSQVQGAKLAYTQSDEISICITDFETPDTSAFYDFRLCKMLSVIPAIATSFFNKQILLNIAKTPASNEDIIEMLEKEPLYQFDAKVWTVPTWNDAFAWFLYRQNDCVKNSKAQAAQTYLSHKTLLGKTSDEQITLLKEQKGIDWYTDYNDGEKYGRLVYRVEEQKTGVFNGKEVEYMRSSWKSFYAPVLNTKEGKKQFIEIGAIPAKEGDYIPEISTEENNE